MKKINKAASLMGKSGYKALVKNTTSEQRSFWRQKGGLSTKLRHGKISAAEYNREMDSLLEKYKHIK